jgi:hypothetical protein
MYTNLRGPLATAAAIVFAMLPAQAGAQMVDLTTSGSFGTINGATFYQYTTDESSGTGVFDPFVRIQARGTESGYNTDAKPELDAKGGIWTHALSLDSIAVRDGYRDFYLDINESSNGTNPLLSLDQLQLFLTTDPNLTGYAAYSGFGSNATMIYDMNSDANRTGNWVKLDYSLSGSGSGRADMQVSFADAIFTSAYTDPVYLVMYSQFGMHGTSPNGMGSNAGFEEWATRSAANAVAPIPEPETYAMLLAGLGLLGFAAQRRKRKQAAAT